MDLTRLMSVSLNCRISENPRRGIGDAQREKLRERETDRQTDRQIETNTDRQTDRQ